MLIITRRRVLTVLVAAVVWLLAVPYPAARADVLVNGVCSLDLTITFGNPKPTLTVESPYTITIDSASTWSWCKLDTLVSTTLVEGTGSTSLGDSESRCGVLAGQGTWAQGFGNGPTDPAPMADGMHVVAGTWLGATMVVSGIPGNGPLRFTGVIELVPHPEQPLANAYKLDTCRSGGNVTSLRMLGVQVFNDPLL